MKRPYIYINSLLQLLILIFLLKLILVLAFSRHPVPMAMAEEAAEEDDDDEDDDDASGSNPDAPVHKKGRKIHHEGHETAADDYDYEDDESADGSNSASGSSSSGDDSAGHKSDADDKDEDEDESSHGDEGLGGEEESSKRHRHFPKCKCRQRFRTMYITNNPCGKTALCYWEIWNYNTLKAASKSKEALKEYRKSTEGICDKYWIHKHVCLIGYPQPRTFSEHCYTGFETCETKLGKLLYDECEPLRKFYGLPKPQDVDWHIQTESLNYDLLQDKDTIFKGRPSPEHPKYNKYYTISCPIIYRFPYFTIDLLLKDMDPSIEYSETSALSGVGEMMPKYARIALNNERILNFDALSLEESLIHWCGIPRNYVCVRRERDKDGMMCDLKRLEELRNQCEEDPEDPREGERLDTPLAVPV